MRAVLAGAPLLLSTIVALTGATSVDLQLLLQEVTTLKDTVAQQQTLIQGLTAQVTSLASQSASSCLVASEDREEGFLTCRLAPVTGGSFISLSMKEYPPSTPPPTSPPPEEPPPPSVPPSTPPAPPTPPPSLPPCNDASTPEGGALVTGCHNLFLNGCATESTTPSARIEKFPVRVV